MMSETVKAFILSLLLYLVLSIIAFGTILLRSYDNESGVLMMGIFILAIIILSGTMSIVNTFFFYLVTRYKSDSAKREIAALLFGLLYSLLFIWSMSHNPGFRPTTVEFIPYCIIIFVHIITYFYVIRPGNDLPE